MSKRVKRNLAMFCLGASVLPGAALAQDERRFDVIVSGEIRHDSNVLRRGITTLDGFDQSGSDQRFIPNVAIEVARPFGRNVLSASASAGYDFYRRNTFLNRERLALNADLASEVGPCSTNLGTTFSRRQSDLADFTIIVAPNEEAAERFLRNVQTVQSYRASAVCGSAIGLTVNAGIQRDIGDNSADIREFSNFRTMQYEAGVGYRNTTLGALTLFGRINDIDYPNRSEITGFDENGFRSRTAGVRYSRGIGLRWTATAEAGYTDTNPERPGVDGFSGITWSLDFRGELTDRLQVGVNTSKSVSPTLTTDAAFQVQRAWTLDATYFVNPRISVNAAASISRRRFEGAGSLFGVPLVNDTRRVYSASLNYEWARDLNSNLNIVYDQRDGDVGGAGFREFDSDNFGIGLRISKTF